jgi:hypothetical protein
MAATLDRQEMFRLARMGAEARLRALELERAQILRSFPGLTAAAAQPSATAGLSEPAPVRRRREMSAAERKSVSARMKRYWAERRKSAATKKD